MKLCFECIPCMLNSVIRLFNEDLIKKEKHELIYKKILKLLSNEDFNYSPPKIAQIIHRVIREESGNKDPYSKIKKKYNSLCMEIYDDLITSISMDKDYLYKGLKLSILGNVIDFGPNHSFNLIDILGEMESINFAIDDSDKLFKDLKNAKMILFLGDNAGEIVFDKLFLKLINHKNLYYAVRGNAVINDATREDVSFCNLDKIAKIIDTGTDMPGIDLKESSNTFMKIYNESDIIISKGQGNYESLNDVKNKNIYFLLMAKCKLVADQLGVNIGNIIIKNNN